MLRVTTEKALKRKNLKWLLALAAFDAVVVVLFIAPEIVTHGTTTELAIVRAVGGTLLPVLVLVVTSVLPHEVKAALVYWRLKDVLPGCQAFDRYGPKDPRVDMSRLEKNVGPLPTGAREQNQKWFALYRLVQNDVPVFEAHNAYLLFRDMASISVLLFVAAPVCLYVSGTPSRLIWTTAAFFAVQYLATALSARWSGIRMVSNVLAVHSATRIAGAKPR